MMNSYIFEYLDENDFRKKERSVRKYNMLAYKKLTFNTNWSGTQIPTIIHNNSLSILP